VRAHAGASWDASAATVRRTYLLLLLLPRPCSPLLCCNCSHPYNCCCSGSERTCRPHCQDNIAFLCKWCQAEIQPAAASHLSPRVHHICCCSCSAQPLRQAHHCLKKVALGWVQHPHQCAPLRLGASAVLVRQQLRFRGLLQHDGVEAQGARNSCCCCMAAHCRRGARDLCWRELIQRVICSNSSSGGSGISSGGVSDAHCVVCMVRGGAVS
jgi:hypothetical protein